MPVTNDTYDQLKIDKLKHFLETQAAKAQAKPFEIFVDNLKVVSRTEDPKDFDNYEFYMNEDTEKVRILIYNSNLSPRNDQYSFLVQKNKVEKSLNGLGEVENIIQEKLAARDREHETNRLREELTSTKEELQETEEYAEKLEKEIEYLKENKFKLGNINIGELASVAVEGMIRRNPQFLTKLPGGEALAGIIEQDNKDQESRLLKPNASPETAASFQKKEETSETQFSETEVRQLHFLNQLQEGFDQKQIEIFNIILGRLAADPSQLQNVAKLFQINY
jgi:vacuolar-type H+-ATPase subunit I/STV1